MAYALGRLRFFDNFHAIEEFGPSLLSGVRAGILAELEQKAWMDYNPLIRFRGMPVGPWYTYSAKLRPRY